MKKIAKKWGSSLAILLTKEEREIYGIEGGDILDMEITNVIKRGGQNG